MPILKSTPRVLGAILYTRVSTGEQAEHGTSLASQRDACRAKALALSLPVVAICEDPGVSGSDYHTRPGIMEALRLVESGAASVLIATKIDRVGRSAHVVLDIVNRIEKAGGELITGDANFDNTPGGHFLRTIYAGVAEMEREAIKERTYGGRVRLAQQGIQTSRNFSPFGYHVVGTADVLRGLYPAEQRGKYQVVEEEAAFVREMFTRYADGAASLVGLARWLTESGVPTRARATFWRPNAVRYILSNPVYKGMAAFGKVDHSLDESRLGQLNPLTGKPMRTRRICRPAPLETWITFPCPALVTEDLWERVQGKFGQNQSKAGGNPKRVRVLAGRVFCPRCSAPLHVLHTPKRTDPHKDSYLCSTYRKKLENTKEQGCLPNYYPVSIVEEAVTLAMLHAAQSPQSVRDALEVYRKAQEEPQEAGEDVTAKRARIAKDRAALDARQKATVEAQIAGIMAGLTADAYAAVFAELASARVKLDTEEMRIVSLKPTPMKQQARAVSDTQTLALALEDMARVLRSSEVSDATKRNIIGRVVEAVYPIEERAPYQREGGWGARVVFTDGALDGLVEDADYMSQTFQPSGKKCCLNFIVA